MGVTNATKEPINFTRPRGWVVALAAAALIAAYLPTLQILVNLWSTDEDLGHCFLVPPIVGWIIWRERSKWQKLPLKPSGWGIFLLALGAVMQAMALMGLGVFAGSVAFLVSLVGGVLAIGGFPLIRAWRFPLLLSLFLLPKLVIVYNQFTLPLQLLATRLAAGTLSMVGVAAARQGNVLSIAGRQVAVVEACNGMRYLLSLGFLAAVFAYLGGARPAIMWTMLALVAPIAILANALRVAAVGYTPLLESGAPHTVAGIVVFLFCLAILAVASKLANRWWGELHV
jgi:exosortase